MSLKLDNLIRHLQQKAKAVQTDTDLEHHRGTITLLLEQAAEELVRLRDDLAALRQQGSDHA